MIFSANNTNRLPAWLKARMLIALTFQTLGALQAHAHDLDLYRLISSPAVESHQRSVRVAESKFREASQSIEVRRASLRAEMEATQSAIRDLEGQLAGLKPKFLFERDLLTESLNNKKRRMTQLNAELEANQEALAAASQAFTQALQANQPELAAELTRLSDEAKALPEMKQPPVNAARALGVRATLLLNELKALQDPALLQAIPPQYRRTQDRVFHDLLTTWMAFTELLGSKPQDRPNSRVALFAASQLGGVTATALLADGLIQSNHAAWGFVATFQTLTATAFGVGFYIIGGHRDLVQDSDKPKLGEVVSTIIGAIREAPTPFIVMFSLAAQSVFLPYGATTGLFNGYLHSGGRLERHRQRILSAFVGELADLVEIPKGTKKSGQIEALLYAELKRIKAGVAPTTALPPACSELLEVESTPVRESNEIAPVQVQAKTR